MQTTLALLRYFAAHPFVLVVERYNIHHFSRFKPASRQASRLINRSEIWNNSSAQCDDGFGNFKAHIFRHNYIVHVSVELLKFLQSSNTDGSSPGTKLPFYAKFSNNPECYSCGGFFRNESGTCYGHLSGTVPHSHKFYYAG